jgi:hypothetical protein
VLKVVAIVEDPPNSYPEASEEPLAVLHPLTEGSFAQNDAIAKGGVASRMMPEAFPPTASFGDASIAFDWFILTTRCATELGT